MSFAADETTELSPVADEVSQPLPIPGDPDEWYVGAVIDDRYELERRLGQGAMGEVYLARDRLLKKYVALKALRAELAQQIEVLRRFRREVALAHSVTHPAVVRIYDTGEAHGLPYFTMEYLRGQTLEDLLGELADGAPRMSIREIRETAHEILTGMQAAHEAGVIHRDLKPANVMLTRRGAIVMDFGVAGFGNVAHLTPTPDFNDVGDVLVRTEAGTIFGSPAYMGPELWDGEAASVQTDLYAFGVLLYQMLTGELPISAPNASAFLARLREGKYPPVRSLRRDTPLAMANLISRCMSHDLQQRPRSADEAARQISPVHRRRRLALAAGGLAIVGATTAWAVAETDDWTPMGLPDAVALEDLEAAVRSFDVGAHDEALEILRRLESRSPRSAAVAFWRATVHHDAGADRLRREQCPRGDLRGDETWAEAASAACAKTYELTPAALESLDGQGPFEEQLTPLAVMFSLVPELEGTRDRSSATLSRARAIASRLEDEPKWTDQPIVLPVRWQLARAQLLVALDDAAGAAGIVDELLESHRGAPSAMAYGSWLSAQLGRRDRADQLALAVLIVDARPHVRLVLDEGRLDAAARILDDEAESVVFPSMLESWCGYAFRYELAEAPERCLELAPGLVHAMWVGGSTERDNSAMSPAERGVLDRQIELNQGKCLEGPPKTPALKHLIPPFSTYIRQLEISSALCPGGAADLELAASLAHALVDLDPGDPWTRLLDAQVGEFAGEVDRAARERAEVARDWGAADLRLPLVARLRELVIPDGFDPAKTDAGGLIDPAGPPVAVGPDTLLDPADTANSELGPTLEAVFEPGTGPTGNPDIAPERDPEPPGVPGASPVEPTPAGDPAAPAEPAEPANHADHADHAEPANHADQAVHADGEPPAPDAPDAASAPGSP